MTLFFKSNYFTTNFPKETFVLDLFVYLFVVVFLFLHLIFELKRIYLLSINFKSYQNTCTS